jgi:hypothetical protein
VRGKAALGIDEDEANPRVEPVVGNAGIGDLGGDAVGTAGHMGGEDAIVVAPMPQRRASPMRASRLALSCFLPPLRRPAAPFEGRRSAATVLHLQFHHKTSIISFCVRRSEAPTWTSASPCIIGQIFV